MNSWKGQERRKFPRINYPCLVTIRPKKGEPEVILTHTVNIGVGGVCVILKRDVDATAPIELEIDLLDAGNHIQCKGRVVWSIQRGSEEKSKPSFYDIGIEFSTVNEEDQRRLDSIVKKLVQQGSNLIKD